MPDGGGRFSLGAGALGSLLLHGLALALALLMVQGHVLPPRPRPPTVVTLDLTPPPPPKPPPPKPEPPKPPPPKPQPQPTPVPQPITAQPLSAAPMPTVPPPPMPPPLDEAKPLAEPPPAPKGPQPGVVGYRVSEAYKQTLENVIQHNLRYPPMAARRGQQGTALVKVRMKRDGTVESVTLVKGAGAGSLDDEAKAVFDRIGKLPKLPGDFLSTASEFEFEIPITFRLVGG